MVWTMLFSRMVEPPRRFSTEIASTAIGIDALTVRPARRPEVDGGRAEQQAEQHADDDGLERELGGRLRRRDVGLKRARPGTAVRRKWPWRGY